MGPEKLHAFISQENKEFDFKLVDNFINDLLQSSVYFQSPQPGLNGPNEFFDRVMAMAVDGKKREIPFSLVSTADRFLNEAAKAVNISTMTFKQISKYMLERIENRIKK